MRSDTHDPLLRALQLLELRPRRVLTAVAAGVATLGSALALAALSAWLITRAWEMPPVLDLSVAVVAVRALGISRGVFRYLERLTTHDVALRGTTAARSRIYQQLAAGDPAAAAGLRRGDLLARTGADVDALGDVVVKALIPIAVSVVLAFAAVGILLFISVPAALILAVALAVSGIAAPWLSARAARLAEADSSAAAARFSESAVTALDHSAELRVSGRLDQSVSEAVSAENEVVDATDRAAVPSAFAAAATPLAIGVSVLGALLIGITLYGTTDMSPMSMGILVLLPLSAFEGTAILPSAAVALTKARLASARIMAVLDRAAEEHVEGDRAWPENGALSVHALQAGWPGGKVTEPLSVDLPRGARVAVVGESGSGKTTALMTMAGLLPPVAERFASAEWMFRISIRPNCVGTSDTSPKTHTFSRRRYSRTCASRGVTSPPRTRRRHLPPLVSESGCRNCRTDSTPTWSAVCERFRAVSVVGCCWHARSSRPRRYCCSTSRPSAWTRRPALSCSASCSVATQRWSILREPWLSSPTNFRTAQQLTR